VRPGRRAAIPGGPRARGRVMVLRMRIALALDAAVRLRVG
jgi:hypothetical protein